MEKDNTHYTLSLLLLILCFGKSVMLKRALWTDLKAFVFDKYRAMQALFQRLRTSVFCLSVAREHSRLTVNHRLGVQLSTYIFIPVRSYSYAGEK